MKKSILLLLSLFLFRIGTAQNFNESFGAPVIVLIESDPWLMVIGSDVPSFALYSNGHIIYKKKENNRTKYLEAKLSQEEAQKVIKTFGITDSLMKASNYYQASLGTDQPTNELILNFDSTKVISVYGSLNKDNVKGRNIVPSTFLTVYDNLKKFDYNKSEEWLPEKIEVLLTDYRHSPEKPKEWPKEWPDLKSQNTVERSENLYSVYLDKKLFSDFINLRKSLKEKQAVMVNGKKFSISYRLPFPNIK